MPTERDQPWWADAQEYRHRETRRRTLDDAPAGSRQARSSSSRSSSSRSSASRSTDPVRSADQYETSAARRRRAAAARASAQERRAKQRRHEPEEFGWVDESPFSPSERAGERERMERESHRRARERDRRPGSPQPGTGVARRPGARPARRRSNPLLARPEKLLLYAALLGLFLVLAAVSNSDAAVVVHHVASPR